MKALVGAFNQEKALVGAFSVIVQPVVEPMDRFAALLISWTSAGIALLWRNSDAAFHTDTCGPTTFKINGPDNTQNMFDF